MSKGINMSLFGALAGLRGEPIGNLAAQRALREGFRTHPINPHAEAFSEPLVDVHDLGIAGENYYHSHRNPPYWRRIEGAVSTLAVRRSVGEKLKRVNARLEASTLELFLFDAWRPRAVQAYFHDVWMPQELRKRDPELSGERLRAAVERYWAAPTERSEAPAPHATGAAVDLTVRWIGAEQLWMGSIFDDVTALAHRDHFESVRPQDLSFSDEEARANRRLLHWVMAEEGFVGHPDEWWHFSWGDQLWAKLSGNPSAHYGLAEAPDNPPAHLGRG
jgi:D-alanyl-D-alanine dipeptidase